MPTNVAAYIFRKLGPTSGKSDKPLSLGVSAPLAPDPGSPLRLTAHLDYDISSKCLVQQFR